MKLSKLLAGAAVLGLMATPASAATVVGNSGVLGADGVVSVSPSGSSVYHYVSTSGGVSGGGEIAGVGGTNGSSYTTSSFAAGSGDLLKFYFNYVTSDGSGYADYAWAKLIDGSGNDVAYLFTARTEPTGNTSPGLGLPANAATLTPAATTIQLGTDWSPLGSYSGHCYAVGCGHTGWIQSDYTIGTAGTYTLEFGVTNWTDTIYDSGLAFDGITVGSQPIDPSGAVPEPAVWVMLLLGFGTIGTMLRGSRRKEAAVTA